jgi:hypothetical protein
MDGIGEGQFYYEGFAPQRQGMLLKQTWFEIKKWFPTFKF